MHQACDLVFPCSVLSGSVCTAVNSMADYNAAGALITARSGKVARRPSMKRRHSFDLSKRRSFLTAPGRKSLDVRPHCSSLAGVRHFFFGNALIFVICLAPVPSSHFENSSLRVKLSIWI